jgi:UDP-glucose 4-epimerase
MQVLITGGAGFVGSHLAEYHLARGDHVSVVDDLSTGSVSNLAHCTGHPRFRFESADIVTWPGLDDAVAQADRVYHLAAVVGMFRVLERPVDVMRVNVIGTERVLEALLRAGRRSPIVLASSSSVYGRSPTGDMREEADLTLSPNSPLLNYELSKLGNEVQGLSYARAHALPVVVVRLFNTIGPRQAGTYGFVVPRFVQQALSGAPITVFGDGSQTRSFCDVRDTVAALATLAGTAAAQGQVVNIGNAREITIGELAALVRARAGSKSAVEYVPYAQAYGRPFEQVHQRRPDLTRLHALIDLRPQWTLEATIDDLVQSRRQESRAASDAAPQAVRRSAA